MRRLLIVPALLAGLVLAGCGTLGGGDISGQISGTVAQVQSVTQQICGFVPTISTVGKIVSTFTGGGGVVDVVSQVANGICSAVAATPKSLSRGRYRLARAPVYRGVRIQGSFAR